jgi:hypothetical protein
MKKLVYSILGPLVLLAFVVFNARLSTVFAQGTAFAYQGRLTDSGSPATGNYDLTFTLYDSTNLPGIIIAGPLSFSAVAISNGMLNATLDFGPGVFRGSSYWLDIAMRTNGGGSFTELTPRQLLLPVPYAIMANSASNLLSTLPASQLPGAVVTTNETSVLLNNLNLSGALNLSLPQIFTAGIPLLYSDGHQNFFAGLAGNTNTTGLMNTAVGNLALVANTSGSFNTANGFAALQNNKDGAENTANGYQALFANASGSDNTASGYEALGNNMGSPQNEGNYNTANGALALNANTSGSYNTAVGFEALQVNQSSYNTACGAAALFFDVDGGDNAAVGYGALFHDTFGSFNTAIGSDALGNNTIGNFNVASGYSALLNCTNGIQNTADGYEALQNNNNGSANTACGDSALYSGVTGNGNTAVGLNALYYTIGSYNIAVGLAAGADVTTGSNNIEIFDAGQNSDNNTIRIGSYYVQTSTFIAGIYGATASGGVPVYVNSSGRLGTLTSSAKYKQDIKNMDDASDVLLALRPVTFKYKPAIDPGGTPQFGLVAEEVDKVDPELVVRDPQHGIYTVRYEAVNAMLLNEFLKEHRKVEELESRLEKLEQAVKENPPDNVGNH